MLLPDFSCLGSLYIYDGFHPDRRWEISGERERSFSASVSLWFEKFFFLLKKKSRGNQLEVHANAVAQALQLGAMMMAHRWLR
jgi:hypothetical protein